MRKERQRVWGRGGGGGREGEWRRLRGERREKFGIGKEIFYGDVGTY
jgi:hypothetical protein